MNHKNITTRPLISEELITYRIYELRQQIQNKWIDANDTPLVVIGIMNGALPFMGSIINGLISDNVYIDTIKASSYSGTESTSKLTTHNDITTDIKDKNVILVDDILDTGITLSNIIQHIKQLNPKSISTCVLLDKPNKRKVNIKADYVGFKIDDHFVVGYGMDYNGLYRNRGSIDVIIQDN